MIERRQWRRNFTSFYSMIRIAAAFVLISAIVPTLINAKDTISFEKGLKAHIEICRASPQFLIGGAALAECLDERSAAIDAETDGLIAQQPDRFCALADQSALRDAQVNWLSYRQALCQTVARSPGNTAAAINASVCRLMLSEQRLKAQQFLQVYARPRCVRLQLQMEASRSSQDLGGAVDIPGSDINWELLGGFRDNRLIVRRSGDGVLLADADISECHFCTGPDDNCERDGIFVLQDPEVPSRPRIFAVCHVGAHSQRIVLFDPIAKGSQPALNITAAYVIDWRVNSGRLEIFLDGENNAAHVWPPQPQ